MPKKAPDFGQDATALSARADMDMTDEELEAHIFCCGQQLEAAYARYERYRVPADRDAAVELLHMRDRAIKARSPAQQARITAAIEKAIDEGVDYFQVMGARDGKALREGSRPA